ncbi:MAG: hypothetical protein ACLFVB_07975, partial [Thermoplasmata archaeon]
MTDYDGYNDIGGNGNSEFWNHIKNTGIKATHEVIGSTPILGPIYNANVFIANEFASGGANFVDDNDGTGPNSKAYAEFRALPNFFEISDWNNRINYEDGGEGDYYLYTAETHFTVTLPDSTDEPHTLNLKFSAINKMSFWQGGTIDTGSDPLVNGAETSVTVTIRNGEIQSVKNNPTSDTYNTYTGSKSVSTTVGVNIPHHQPEVPIVDYLKVDWGDGSDVDTIKEDWEPYTYEKPSGQDWYYFEDKETVASHTYSLPDDIDPGGSKDYNITVTAKMRDKYGGWEVSNTKTITINYLEDDGGGGGGCPYISPWNGTKFKRENNLMVQSEFQSGEVTDY